MIRRILIKNLLVYSLLLLAPINLFAAIDGIDDDSRQTTFDSMQSCQRSGGIWREFGNDCANNCPDPSSSNICAPSIVFSCQCDKNSCFYEGECISLVRHKKNLAKEEKERLEKEEKILQATKAAALRNSANPNQNSPSPQQNQDITTTILLPEIKTITNDVGNEVGNIIKDQNKIIGSGDAYQAPTQNQQNKTQSVAPTPNQQPVTPAPQKLQELPKLQSGASSIQTTQPTTTTKSAPATQPVQPSSSIPAKPPAPQPSNSKKDELPALPPIPSF